MERLSLKYLKTADISLSDLEVPKRLRVINPDWVQAIAESMAAEGQKTPIEVIEQLKGKKYRLVAGGHRVVAAERQGWKTIRAEIKQPEKTKGDELELELLLHEIDENLHRHELKPMDRAVFIGQRQEIYEQLYPDTKAGVAGGKARHGIAAEKISFTEATAEKIGLGQRSVQRATRIYRALTELPEDLREKMSSSALADSEGDLYRLTRESPATRAKIVAAILAGKAVGVAAAADMVAGTAKKAPPAHELQAKKIRDAWDRAGKKARTAHLEFLVSIGVIDGYETGHL